MNDELPGITTTKTFFRSGDLDVASIDWGNGYHVYFVKTTYSKLNSVPVVPIIFSKINLVNNRILFSPSISEVNNQTILQILYHGI